MKIFCVVFFAAFLQLKQAHPNPSSPSLSFVYEGDIAEEGEFPHQLMIQLVAGNVWRRTCGAALISKYQALTAAHCITSNDLSSYRVLAGLHDQLELEGVQITPLKDILMHPNYHIGFGINPNDIAILIFNTSLELNDKVQPITWNQDNDLNFTGKQCVISGWGSLYQDNWDYPFINPRLLHKATMDILPNDECVEMFNPSSYNDGHICTYNPSQGFSKGDSGGPLTCQHNGQPILAGVGSFLYPYSHKHPSGYTKVSHFKDFINDNLGDLKPNSNSIINEY